MQNNERKDKLVGSIWSTQKNGKTVRSGVVFGKRVFIVANTKKKGDKSPDFFVFEADGDDDVTF